MNEQGNIYVAFHTSKLNQSIVTIFWEKVLIFEATYQHIPITFPIVLHKISYVVITCAYFLTRDGNMNHV